MVHHQGGTLRGNRSKGVGGAHESSWAGTLEVIGTFIGYIKGKETKGIITRKPMVLKAVMFSNSNYATDKETRKSVSGLVDTLGGTLLTCSSKTQRTVTLISTEAEYVALSTCAQEVKFVSMLLGEMTEVEKPSIIY